VVTSSEPTRPREDVSILVGLERFQVFNARPGYVVDRRDRRGSLPSVTLVASWESAPTERSRRTRTILDTRPASFVRSALASQIVLQIRFLGLPPVGDVLLLPVLERPSSWVFDFPVVSTSSRCAAESFQVGDLRRPGTGLSYTKAASPSSPADGSGSEGPVIGHLWKLLSIAIVLHALYRAFRR
jgi:hypothetical protein